MTEAVGELDDVVKRLPLTGDAGVTDRSDIRARELAALMRSSVAVNRLASRPLYRTVICDDYASLIKHIKCPRAHPLIESSAELLSLTRSLHLEYSQKHHATYISIMNDPRHWEPISRVSRSEIGPELARIEATKLFEAFYLRDTDEEPSAFPNVTRLTTGAVFGGQDGVWKKTAQMHDAANPRERARVDFCRRMIAPTFEKSPISQLCQRGCEGPFALPMAFSWTHQTTDDSSPLSPIFTMHYTTKHMRTRMPAAIGHKIRWILDNHPPAEDSSDIAAGVGGGLPNIRDCSLEPAKGFASDQPSNDIKEESPECECCGWTKERAVGSLLSAKESKPVRR